MDLPWTPAFESIYKFTKVLSYNISILVYMSNIIKDKNFPK